MREAHGEPGVEGVCIVLRVVLVFFGAEDGVEGRADIVRLVLHARVPLWHVRNVNKVAIAERDRVGMKCVGLSLEVLRRELHIIRLPLRVHLPAIAEEVLGVPELRLDSRGDHHGAEGLLALVLFLACGISESLQVLASIDDENEVIGVASCVVRRRVLDPHNRLLTIFVGRTRIRHVRAEMSRDLLPEHHANRVLVIEALALDTIPCADDLVVLALEPQAREVLVLLASNDTATLNRVQLVGDKEVDRTKLL